MTTIDSKTSEIASMQAKNETLSKNIEENVSKIGSLETEIQNRINLEGDLQAFNSAVNEVMTQKSESLSNFFLD